MTIFISPPPLEFDNKHAIVQDNTEQVETIKYVSLEQY